MTIGVSDGSFRNMSDNKIIIRPCSATQALELKSQLDTAGLELNVDYVWRYISQKSHWDDLGEYREFPQQAVFEFFRPELALFYSLKWQQVVL